MLKMITCAILLLAIAISVPAQIYVKIRPHAPIMTRPAPPSKVHVWIGDEWEPNGKEYRYTGGHWDKPPHQGYKWRAGHWRRHHQEGEEWVPGNWRKR